MLCCIIKFHYVFIIIASLTIGIRSNAKEIYGSNDSKGNLVFDFYDNSDHKNITPTISELKKMLKEDQDFYEYFARMINSDPEFFLSSIKKQSDQLIKDRDIIDFFKNTYKSNGLDDKNYSCINTSNDVQKVVKTIKNSQEIINNSTVNKCNLFLSSNNIEHINVDDINFLPTLMKSNEVIYLITNDNGHVKTKKISLLKISNLFSDLSFDNSMHLLSEKQCFFLLSKGLKITQGEDKFWGALGAFAIAGGLFYAGYNIGKLYEPVASISDSIKHITEQVVKITPLLAQVLVNVNKLLDNFNQIGDILRDTINKDNIRKALSAIDTLRRQFQEMIADEATLAERINDGTFNYYLYQIQYNTDQIRSIILQTADPMSKTVLIPMTAPALALYAQMLALREKYIQKHEPDKKMLSVYEMPFHRDYFSLYSSIFNEFENNRKEEFKKFHHLMSEKYLDGFHFYIPDSKLDMTKQIHINPKIEEMIEARLEKGQRPRSSLCTVHPYCAGGYKNEPQKDWGEIKRFYIEWKIDDPEKLSVPTLFVITWTRTKEEYEKDKKWNVEIAKAVDAYPNAGPHNQDIETIRKYAIEHNAPMHFWEEKYYKPMLKAIESSLMPIYERLNSNEISKKDLIMKFQYQPTGSI
ncbi:MAG: hypothetical protein HQK50_16445 [Oligoflexia bacterium]|nr:hypothetical protein [Oligoflexia bacterium]MBF0367167.1 hypothetical protein [Oligoflexia bacterium]